MDYTMENSRVKARNEIKIETAIQEALFGVIIDSKDYFATLTRCFKPSDSSKYSKHSCKQLLYKKVEPIMPEADHQISTMKEQQQTIESDDNLREREMITTSFPQCTHGMVIIKESESETTMKWGSGVLIGPDLVLTAAHDVYDNQKPVRKKYPYIRFIPGANGDEAPFGEIEVQDMFVPEKFISYQGEEENYALLILTTPIGREIGYCGLEAISVEHLDRLKDQGISVVGYPTLEKMKEKSEISFEQWRERGIIHKIEAETGIIYYDATAGPSQGGGGVFSEVEKTKNYRAFFVIGVHVGRDKDSALACMITKERFQELLQFINASEVKSKKYEEIIQSKDDKEGIIKKLCFRGKFLEQADSNVLAEYRLPGLEEIDLFYNPYITSKGIELLFKNAVWENLQIINLNETSIGNDTCYSLSENDTWKRLKSLFLRKTDIGHDGVSAIVKSKIFLGLEEIDLSHNKFGTSGILILADNTLPWANLKRLYFGGNNIGDEGASSIGMNTNWKHLEILSLSQNQIGDKSTILLRNNTTWKNLKVLRLDENKVRDDGAASIGNNTTWIHLEELQLSRNEIGDKGATAIGNNMIWTKLKLLDLRINRIAAQGGEAIGKNTTWQFLEVLDLFANTIQNRGALAIGYNSTWSNLKELSLSQNQIGDEGGVAIGRNTTWKKLERLYIDSNRIGCKGASMIGRNQTWKRLEYLNLEANQIGFQGQVALARNSTWRFIKDMNLMDNRRPTSERINALRAIALVNPKRIDISLPAPSIWEEIFE